jgi:hypothetical protein
LYGIGEGELVQQQGTYRLYRINVDNGAVTPVGVTAYGVRGIAFI